MATGTLGKVARTLSFEAVHYLSFTINWNDLNVGTAFLITQPYLPAGAMVLFTNVFISVAFNAGGSNTLSIGTNASSYNNIVATSDVNAGVASQGAMILRGMDLGKLSADSQVGYIYTQSGAAATAGKAYAVIAYVIDNDINRGT